MDNNPFRSHQPQTGNYMTPTMGGQQQQQQPQQPPYQSSYAMGGNGYNASTPTMGTTPQSGYQQQQSWQYQQPQTGMMSPTPPPPHQSNFASTLPQQSSFTSSLPSTTTGPPPSQFSPYTANASLMSSAATSNVSTPPQMNTFGAGGNTYQPYSMPTPNTGIGNYPNNNNMMFNNPGYQQPYQQQQQQHDPSNFYIPPNFGMSTPTTTTNTNNNMFQPQQPRHAPVDASTLLKGTQVRRVECPVCQKMIEGDDMAVNHHVNEHYS